MMLAGISGLIGLIIFVALSILFSLLKRKGEGEFELPPELKPRRDKPPPNQNQSAPPRSWEEQLRRLLDEHTGPPPIVQEMPPPPPPFIQKPPQVFIPPARKPVVHPIPVQEDVEPHIQVEMHVPRPHIEPSFQKLAGLTDSDARYAQASHLQERVAQHLADVTRHRVGQTAVIHRAVAPQVRQAIASVRDREAVRTAMLASIILGPPRGLET